MKDDWTKTIKARLAAAKADPPRADVIGDHVRAAVRRQGSALAARGAQGRASVVVRQNHVAITVSGRDSAAMRQAITTDLRKHRHELREAVKAEAQRKLKGIGR